MARRKGGVSIRFSLPILAQIDALVEEERYTSRSEFVQLAVFYALNRDGLRRDLRDDILIETEKILERRLYSSENTQFLERIMTEVAQKVIHDTRQKA